MFSLERLPKELILMILEELASIDDHENGRPRALLALISASPVCLGVYTSSSALVRRHVSALARRAFQSCLDFEQALTAATLRVELRNYELVGERNEQLEQVHQLARPHIERALSAHQRRSNCTSCHLRRPAQCPKGFDLASPSTSHLTELLHLDALVCRVGRRVTDLFKHHHHLWWPGCTPRYRQAIGLTRVLEPLLLFQIYCDSFFPQRHVVLSAKASSYRRYFFSRADEDDNAVLDPENSWEPRHELFHVVLHYVFQEHKDVVRQVARDLGINASPVRPLLILGSTRSVHEKDTKNRQNPLQERAQKLQEAVPSTTGITATGNNRNDTITSRASQIRRLDQRELVMEDGYCRYMMSFSVELVDRLVNMSPDERCEFTLSEFSSFVDQHKISQSRCAQTAWFWDLARRAEIGTY